jgi:transposase
MRSGNSRPVTRRSLVPDRLKAMSASAVASSTTSSRASVPAASVQDASSFAGPREFAAFLGLTPKQSSSGGKPKLGRISKMGNRYLRKLLVVGAHAVLFHRKPHTDPLRMWAKKLIEKKPFKLVAVALANKMARIAFAILRGKTVYREIPA